MSLSFRLTVLCLSFPVYFGLAWAVKNPASVAVSRVENPMDPVIASPAYQQSVGVAIPGLMLAQTPRQAPAEHPAGDEVFTTCRSVERPRRPYRCLNVHTDVHRTCAETTA